MSKFLDGVDSRGNMYVENPNGYSRMGVTFSDGYYTTMETTAGDLPNHWCSFVTRDTSNKVVRINYLPNSGGTLLNDANIRRYRHHLYIKVIIPDDSASRKAYAAFVRAEIFSAYATPITHGEWSFNLPEDVLTDFEKNQYVAASGAIIYDYYQGTEPSTIFGLKLGHKVGWVAYYSPHGDAGHGISTAYADLLNIQWGPNILTDIVVEDVVEDLCNT